MNIGVILGCNIIKEVKQLDKLELVKGLSSLSIVNKAFLKQPYEIKHSTSKKRERR